METELENKHTYVSVIYSCNTTRNFLEELALVTLVTITDAFISVINDVKRGRPCRLNEGELRHVTINAEVMNDVQIITLSQVIRRNEQNEQLPFLQISICSD